MRDAYHECESPARLLTCEWPVGLTILRARRLRPRCSRRPRAACRTIQHRIRCRRTAWHRSRRLAQTAPQRSMTVGPKMTRSSSGQSSQDQSMSCGSQTGSPESVPRRARQPAPSAPTARMRDQAHSATAQGKFGRVVPTVPAAALAPEDVRGQSFADAASSRATKASPATKPRLVELVSSVSAEMAICPGSGGSSPKASR
jgi:hypothetical protein